MRKRFSFLLLGFSIQLSAINYTDPVHDTAHVQKKDTSLGSFFRRGHFHGHSRTYFMATDNSGSLTDFHAMAFGLGIGYETPRIHGFSIGLSGYFIYNLFSSDLAAKDPSSNQGNRYEIGLFDVGNPSNHKDLDRLEDLYLRYGNDRSHLKFGKQHIRTPFINPQDGRMRPTLVEGLLGEFNEVKNLTLNLGILYSVSPRSTVEWYSIGESIGKYPLGVGPDGTVSGYAGHTESDWLALFGASYKIGNKVKVELWDQYVDNIFNTGLAQVTSEFSLKKGSKYKLITGAQLITQTAVNEGGNPDSTKAYFGPNNSSLTYGFRLGLRNEKKWSITFNFTEITNQGRYLMPREWGRDPFFTFMPRERFEGYGDSKAFNAVFSMPIPKSKFKFDLGYGYYLLPDVKDPNLNKYGFPSYTQFNFDLRYKFEKALDGMDLQFLYVYKGGIGESYGNSKYVINKINMSLYNLILNYQF